MRNDFQFLSNIYLAMQQVVLAAAPLSLVAVSWERFKWIVLTFNEKMSLNQAKLILVIIWLIGLLNGLPILGAMQMNDIKLFDCNEAFPKHVYRQLYTMFNFILFYLVPVLFITPLYIQMVMRLRQRTDTTGQLSDVDLNRRKAALKMLLIVVITYAVCVLPNHIIFILWDFHQGKYFYLIINQHLYQSCFFLHIGSSMARHPYIHIYRNNYNLLCNVYHPVA
jgi:hypothetical protein